ncbi:MerR family transcriptional regulator [Novosphingobium sp. Chol11]|uniref:MerR family transcriptional regulator n=1 Tax=Novosphingobium sp. Chol11 TaxID=1385763 RepID=UPI0025D076A7|nr:MerR family transcriptional regulator [Novosphingobium sp. Chol11]
MENPVPSSSNRSVFDDGKETGALRTIGEVAKALGIKHHVLRYWEEQFPMLRPLTRAGGRRYYRTEDIALICEIDRLLHCEGYTIRGARLAIEAGGEGAGQGAGTAKTKAAVYEDAQAPFNAPVLAAPAASDPPERAAAEPEVQEIITALRVLRGHLEGIHDRLNAALDE